MFTLHLCLSPPFLASLSGGVLLLLSCKCESYPVCPQSTLAISGVAAQGVAVRAVAFGLLDTGSAAQKRTGGDVPEPISELLVTPSGGGAWVREAVFTEPPSSRSLELPGRLKAKMFAVGEEETSASDSRALGLGALAGAHA